MRIISGKFGGRSIKTVTGLGYRPATEKVRQALFSMLESRGVFWPEIQVIDLFAGSGSLGLEALSRGAQKVWFVEKNFKAARAIKDNLSFLGAFEQSFKVIKQDVFAMLHKKIPFCFQLAFIDPPYGKNLLLPVLNKIINTSLLETKGLIVAEVEASIDFDPGDFMGLELLVNKNYGQTKICLWEVKDKK